MSNKKPLPPNNPADNFQRRQSMIQRQEAAELIGKMHDMIFDDPKKALGTLPEKLFVDHFLPYFAGQKKDDPKLNIMANWVGVAGSPSNRVDIIDQQGKILFTVPPMESSDFINPLAKTTGPSFYHISETANMRGAVIPEIKQKILIEEGAKKVAHLKGRINPKDEEAWNQIFSRYDIKPSKPLSNNSGPTNKKDDDIFEYD